MALLHAALTTSNLANVYWDGKSNNLADLFPPGPDRTALTGRELVRDYFPHGGFLGAGAVHIPKPIYNAPPVDDLAALFAPFDGLDLEHLRQRADLAAAIFNNYVVGTEEAGHLVIYLPAPRPPAIFWQLDEFARTPQAFVDYLTRMDLPTLIENMDLWPADQFLMAGKLTGQLLGVPLGEAELVVDPGQGLFRIHAGTPSAGWATNFITSEMTAEIRTADYILRTSPEDLARSATDTNYANACKPEVILAAAAAQLAAATSAEQMQQAISNAIARITDTLPKASLTAALDLRLPEELSSILQFNSGAGLYAYSPRFEPGYALPGYAGTILYRDPDPANPGPYTLARRNGGVVAAGHFTFGLNLQDPDPSHRLVIDVPEVALGITGTDQVSAFPALNGRAIVSEISLPNVFAFNGAASPGFRFRNGRLQFNSAPALDADYLALEGYLSPIDLGPFLQVRPLPTNANPENLLGGTLHVTRTTNQPSLALSLHPAAVCIPMLGSLTGLIYGATPANDFTFSTVPGQSWAATVRLDGNLEIRSPLDPAGPVLFQAGAAGGQPFYITIAGSGLQEFTLQAQIPNGVVFTLFPGTFHESRFTNGTGSATCLFIGSDGRVYLDSGTQKLDIPGLARVQGRIELGFEPVDHTPILECTAPSNFFAALGASHEQIVTVRNANPMGGQLVVNARVDCPEFYSVQPSRVLLGGGQSANLRVRFTPPSLEVPDLCWLTLANSGPQGEVWLPLEGASAALPAPTARESDPDQLRRRAIGQSPQPGGALLQPGRTAAHRLWHSHHWRRPFQKRVPSPSPSRRPVMPTSWSPTPPP